GESKDGLMLSHLIVKLSTGYALYVQDERYVVVAWIPKAFAVLTGQALRRNDLLTFGASKVMRTP
ncbi:MAG: hypothetical protein ACI8XC_003741, partial [Gammaproteobacteria bacterium]